MRKVLKIVGILVGVLVAVIVVAALGVTINYNSRANKVYDVAPAALVIPTDAAGLERGQHLVEAVSDCVGCHGPDLAGMPVIDDPALGTIWSKNLTTGQGGLGGQLSDADLELAIRHGLRPDHHSLVVMPSYDYHNLSDADVAAIIAYVRTVPPVERMVPEPTLKPLGLVLTVLGALPTFTAELIDESAALPPAPAPGVTTEYGHYLVQIAGCSGCHGEGLGGGKVPGSDASVPPAPNLTPSGEVGQWTLAMFMDTLRTGVKPSGTPLNDEMPWRAYGHMTDDELAAVFTYLQALPPAEVK
jgi:mono/diheme cytochrome c family protein